NNRLLRLLPPRTRPPRSEPPAAARAAALRLQVGPRPMEPYTLLSIIPDKHAELLTDVLRDPDGRLYSPDGHPLLDYHSVYRTGQPRPGIPVLKMLQTTKGALRFNTNLTREDVNRARIGLVSANSYITAELAQQFKTLGGITLTDNVRVTDA